MSAPDPAAPKPDPGVGGDAAPGARVAPCTKTLATWVALLGGPLGLHRFYLRGLRDPWGWLHAAATLIGVLGVMRMRELGVDDRMAWLMLPGLGLSIAAAMLSAIVFGLTPDERWAERHHPQLGVLPTAWAPVLGVIAALMIGATALMATVAFVAQRLFETLLT